MADRGETLLCVDFSYQVYRATCAHPNLSSGDTFTGGLYGFFAFLGKAVRETRATRLAIACDTKPYLRSRDYPEYKQISRRSRSDPEVRERYETSKRLALEALFEVGAPVYALEGFEADDISMALALRNRHRMERIYLATNDSDAWQGLWMPNLAIYRTDMSDLMTGERLMREHGVTPEQYMLATALSGTHNDVGGIPRVGEKTALAAVKDPSLLRQYRAKHADLIDRNLSLIRLPHPELPARAALLEPPRRAFSPRDLYRALCPYDIDVTDWMVRAFEQTSV